MLSFICKKPIAYEISLSRVRLIDSNNLRIIEVNCYFTNLEVKLTK